MRIVQILTSSGGWYGETVKCDEKVKAECIGEYNEAFLDPLSPYMGQILKVYMIPSVILCIWCYKKREIADYFYHIENLLQILSVFHLNASNYNMEYSQLSVRLLMLYLMYGIGFRAEIIANAITMAIYMFINNSLAYG